MTPHRVKNPRAYQYAVGARNLVKVTPHRVKPPTAYQYAVGARNFVKVGLSVISASSFGVPVENIEDVVAKKGIGNQF